MASTDVGSSASTEMPEIRTIDMKLEVVTLPRVVQLTPPRSGCSMAFGKGLTTAEPGSVQGWELVVDDIDAAREDLIGRGVEDPDGNGWLLQEVKARLPGRELED